MWLEYIKLFYFIFLKAWFLWVRGLCLLVLRAPGCTAPCCPPADTQSVGWRLSAAETGASVPELREQSELSASHSQPAGQTFRNNLNPVTLKPTVRSSVIQSFLVCNAVECRFAVTNPIVFPVCAEAVFNSGGSGCGWVEPVGQSVERWNETFWLDSWERYRTPVLCQLVHHCSFERHPRFKAGCVLQSDSI